MTPERPSVGIVAAAIHMPQTYMTAAEIAAESGLEEWVVREKLGITRKYVLNPAEHPNDMALAAAQKCLEQAQVDADEIDVILCTTEEWREYLLWTAGIDLAHRLGATRAWAMDVHMRCCTSIAAIRTARDMMLANDDVRTVLIAGGYAISPFIDLRNHRTSFLFNIGAGAGALLLKRDWPRNHVLGSHLIVDGSMSRHVVVPASGTMAFPTDDAVAAGRFRFDLVEPEAMKSRLNAVSMDNWLLCVDEALRKSGTGPDGAPLQRLDIAYLNMLLVKPSAHWEMVDRLGLSREQTVYLGEYGHIGEQDTIISIVEGLRQRRLRDGDLMVMLGAGIGYVWGAACVRWGPCE
jgi:3-oxoacyl-[acyl-carrier-protein] synthase III